MRAHSSFRKPGATERGNAGGDSLLADRLRCDSKLRPNASEECLFSITASTRRLIELAARAGVDLDGDESLEEAKALAAVLVVADSSSDEDEIDEFFGADGGSQKERSIMQMVAVLKERLSSMRAVVADRRSCIGDLQASASSRRLPSLGFDNEEDVTADFARHAPFSEDALATRSTD
ncbi:unnamed protein product, partial [Phaeothamnion confervicola]